MAKMYPAHAQRLRRKRRVRKHVTGTYRRPRLTVFRSNRHMYAQVIDDVAGRTVAAASTLEEDMTSGANIGTAAAVGRAVAERARRNGVERIVFDRNGYQYHGKVKALADAAREAGLEF